MRLPFNLHLPKQVPRWQRITGYALFAAIVFVLSLFVTFPHQAFWALVTENAGRAGFDVRVGDYGGAFGGITGYDVRIAKTAAPGAETAPAGLTIAELTLSPTLLPPGLSFEADALGGTFSGFVEGFSLLKLGRAPPQKEDKAGEANVRLELDNVDLSGDQLKNLTGIDMAGKLSANVALQIPVTGVPGMPTYILDTGMADGSITLNSPSLVVNGGTLKGDLPLDLPKVNLGKLDGNLRFEKGAGTLEKFQIKSDELDVQANGTLKLKRALEYSEPAIDLKIKLEPALSQRLGMIAAGLSILPPDRQNPDFRVGRLTGFLNRPRFGPGR